MALAFERRRPIEDGWELCLTEPGVFDAPPKPDVDLDWIAAAVPGTAAGALAKAGRFDPAAPVPLDDHDIWYRAKITGQGPCRLDLGGLATVAEVWLGDACLLRSISMFLAHEINIELSGEHRLFLCFRSLAAHLANPMRSQPKRARWRPRMIQPTSLNGVRTTILGRASGWCPAIHAVGPYRPVTLVQPEAKPVIRYVRLVPYYRNGLATLDCIVEFDRQFDIEPAKLICAGHSASMMRGTSPVAGRLTLFGRLDIADVALWWPHTHGEPVLHDVSIEIAGEEFIVGRTGFRSLEVDRGVDGRGFALIVNGERIFCRGACWTPADLLSLQHGDQDQRLKLMAEAGMNMVRIGGTMVYEGRAFHELCDELGILVWQDFMFANFDYPTDAEFLDMIRREAEQLMLRLSGSPSLAMLCGGSEVYQQGAMMGMPERIWRNPIFEDVLPEISAMFRPDMAYVVNSPSGGALPFSSDSGIAHYYGVGAYMRPIEDARRADVRFAAECLAFANIPDKASLRHHSPECWQRNVPRDAGADWDFSDVRDHYLAVVFGCEPAILRERDLPRYLDLSRASTAHVMRETFAEWRRPGSGNAGGLIWFLADLAFGSGWGVLDADGKPKSVWHALKETLQPLQILLTDEGVNGLMLHAINETAIAQACLIRLRCLRDGEIAVVEGSRQVELAPRSAISIPATDLFGGFFDTTYAFRFGPPGHDVTIAELLDDAGAILSRFHHFPLGLGAFGQETKRHDLGLGAELIDDADLPRLSLSTRRFAAFVDIDVDGFRPRENGFHLAPGEVRSVDLIRLRAEAGPCTGTVGAINAAGSVSFGHVR